MLVNWSVIEARLMSIALKSELLCHMVMSLVTITRDRLRPSLVEAVVDP